MGSERAACGCVRAERGPGGARAACESRTSGARLRVWRHSTCPAHVAPERGRRNRLVAGLGGRWISGWHIGDLACDERAGESSDRRSWQAAAGCQSGGMAGDAGGGLAGERRAAGMAGEAADVGRGGRRVREQPRWQASHGLAYGRRAPDATGMQEATGGSGASERRPATWGCRTVAKASKRVFFGCSGPPCRHRGGGQATGRSGREARAKFGFEF